MLVPTLTTRMVTFGTLAPDVSTTVPNRVAEVCCALNVLMSPQIKKMQVKLAAWRHSANMEHPFTFYARVPRRGMERRSFSDNSDQYIVISPQAGRGVQV